MAFVYADGRYIYFATCGISGGNRWFTGRIPRNRGCGCSTKRVKSKHPPIRDSREEAQRDLDSWAKRNRMVAYHPRDGERET
jgi:hypothetical protein